MITRSVVLGIAATLFAVATASAEVTLKARLSGEQERPVPVTDEGTTGKFEIQFNDDLTAGEYKLQVRDGVRVTQAHLHCGTADVAGPIVVFLAGFHEQGWDVDGTWVNNAAVTDANVVNTACGATLAEIVQSALDGRVYVNVHSVAKPGGVARGQLLGN